MAYTATGNAAYDTWLYNNQKKTTTTTAKPATTKPATQKAATVATAPASTLVPTITPDGINSSAYSIDGGLYTDPYKASTILPGTTYLNNGQAYIMTEGGAKLVDENINPDTYKTTLPGSSIGDTGGTGIPVGTGGTTPNTDALYDAQLTQNINALKAQNTTALANLAKTLGTTLSNLEGVSSGINKEAWTSKNQAAAQSDINQMNYAQTAAAQGIKGSNAMIPELYRNAALQGAISKVNAARDAALAQNSRDVALAQSNYNTDYNALNDKLAYDIAAAQGETDLAKIAAQIQAAKDAQELARQNEQTQYERSQQAKQDALNAAKITGDFSAMSAYDWTPTMITSAQKMWTIDNTPKTGGSGTPKETGLTFSQMSNALNMIQGNNTDDTGQLTSDGWNQMYNFIVANGGKDTNVYLGMLPPKPAGVAPTSGVSYDGVKAVVQQRLTTTPSNGNPGAAIASVMNYLDSSGLSPAEIARMMKELNLG